MLLQSSWLLMLNYQMFPGFGEFIFISVQILKTVVVFALAYSPILLSFAIAFNILMTDSSYFTAGNSVLKIMAMMTGELDINNTLQEDVFWFTKVVFTIFIIVMSVVSMNMIMGLAISDVNQLR